MAKQSGRGARRKVKARAAAGAKGARKPRAAQAARPTVAARRALSMRAVEPPVSPGPLAPSRTARELTARRRAVAKERRERIDAFRKSLRGRPVAAAAPKYFLAEGDSWFDYPKVLGTGGGAISHLKRQMNIDVLNLASAGDEVRQMMGVEQRKRLETLLNSGRPAFDVLLFSGGGNDIVGDQLCLWVRENDGTFPAAQALDTSRFGDVLRTVESGYRDLIGIRDRAVLRTGKPCTIVTHGYDFPPVTGRGVCGYGPWLRPSLAYRGWDDPADQALIVRTMLDRFAQMLQSLERNTPGFRVAPTQGVLGAADWHNELHPNRAGFEKIAGVFATLLRSL